MKKTKRKAGTTIGEEVLGKMTAGNGGDSGQQTDYGPVIYPDGGDSGQQTNYGPVIYPNG